MTYVLLIYRATAAGTAPPDLDEQTALRAHRSLQKEVSSRGQLHAVALLQDARAARTIKRRAGAHEIVDGPYLETKEWLVGFYLLDCADEEEAIAHAKTLCADEEHAVEVRPVPWRWKS